MDVLGYSGVISTEQSDEKSQPVAIDISKYTKTILKIAKEGFKKGFKSFYNRELHTHIFDDLSTAAEIGYGKNWIKFDPHHSPTVKLLQKNLYFFAAGKTMAQLKEMNALLVDDSGKIRNWQNFKTEVLKLNKAYNLRYLQAEYQTAKSSAQMARKWNEAQAVKHLYPNLKYMTAHDERVREDHSKLDGIVRPIDDPFWDTHYPPNGWSCRCSVRSTRDEATKLKDIPEVPIHKHFKHNVGKTGQIFDDKKHPYFKYINECDDDNAKAVLSKKCRKLYEIIEKTKIKFPFYKTVKKTKKGYLKISLWAKNAGDFKQNYEFGLILAEKYKIKLPPYINLTGYKNPDFYIDNYQMYFDASIERKTKNVRNYIRNAFSDKYNKGKQLYNFNKSGLILQISKDELEDALIKINGELKARKKCLYIILKIDKQLITINRNDDLKLLYDKIKKQTK